MIAVEVAEEGPLRAVLHVEQSLGESKFENFISLSGWGPSNCLRVESIVDWHTTGTLAKVVFPLADGNQAITYDLGVGTIVRTTNTPALYEVPAQQWVDVTADDGHGGVAVLSDCKYGWDHPVPERLRLTVLHSPCHILSDMGRHEYAYELLSHAGGWTNGVQRGAQECNQPLMAFVTSKHRGKCQESSSFLSLDNAAIRLMALKNGRRK